MNLDVLIMASSRPHLLNFTVHAFKKYVVNQNVKLRYLMHEDFIFSEESEKSILYAQELKFEIIKKSFPKIGIGFAMDKMFNLIETDYIFYLQDDWEFERPVDLDRLVWIMDKNPEINCITFNKRKNRNPDLFCEHFKSKEYNFNGLHLCIYPGWQFLPGIWRMSKVKEKWRPRKERPEGFWQNQFGSNDLRISNRKHLENNIGAYMYGGFDEYRYVRHIGNSWRMAEWQMINDKPTGKHQWDFMNIKRDRAPWLGKLKLRPINESVKLNKTGLELLEDQPEYIKKFYKGV